LIFELLGDCRQRSRPAGAEEKVVHVADLTSWGSVSHLACEWVA